jgi:hypothetical protein
MLFVFVSETKNTNSPTGRANLFTLVFGKQTLVSQNGLLARSTSKSQGMLCLCFAESMNVLDVKYECNRQNQTRANPLK